MTSVFVNRENKAIFTCPQCTKAKTVDVSKIFYKTIKLSLKVRCPCGHIYPVILERRKFYRKHTSLPGFFKSENDMKELPMTVTNISRSGLQFKSSLSEKLKLGDRVIVEFRLDDRYRSVIKKKVTIMRIDGGTIGTEFCSMDEYDKVLGFYLFN
jgi:hypothetical protein